jgi:hypothetical protein
MCILSATALTNPRPGVSMKNRSGIGSPCIVPFMPKNFSGALIGRGEDINHLLRLIIGMYYNYLLNKNYIFFLSRNRG